MKEISYLESVEFNEDEALQRLKRYLSDYPYLEVQDIYVWFHQSIFCSQVYEEEHILDMVQSVRAFQSMDSEFYLFEPVGYRSEFIRLNIFSYYQYGGPLRTLQDITQTSQRMVSRPNIMQFKTDWEYFCKWAEAGEIPVLPEQIRAFDRQYAFHEHLPLPHSDKFENYYSTFYKVVSWPVFIRKFPEFETQFDTVYYVRKSRYED